MAGLIHEPIVNLPKRFRLSLNEFIVSVFIWARNFVVSVLKSALGRSGVLQFGASSMVDLTVAMSILTLVTASALVLYLQITRSGHTLAQFRYELWLQHYAAQTKNRAAYQSETLSLPEGILEKRISSYRGNPMLILMEFTFHPVIQVADKKTYSYREIVVHEGTQQ
jgi:hypothetical protein